MKCVVWGFGIRGKRIISRLRENEVEAIIDSDCNKIGQYYRGIKIIGFDEYLRNYSQYIILISPIKSEGIKRQLEACGIKQYFDLLDCPSELQSDANYINLDDYVKIFNKGRRYGIYGTEFYSIYFYERMKEFGCSSIYLIPDVEANLPRTQRIIELIPDIDVIPKGSWNQFIDEIYVTTDIRSECLELQEISGLPVTNVFDLTHVIKEYQNFKLTKFRNIHKGERCFIIGTGPSLRMDDLNTIAIQSDKSISVNRIYLAFDQTIWRPDYYMASDSYCIKESEQKIKSISAKSMFVSDSFPPFWNSCVPEHIYRYHCHYSMSSDNKLPNYSEQIEYCIYGSATVTYEAIQLATYMGFSTIYLLGIDFDFSEDYKDVKNHFTADYYIDNSKARLFAKEQQLKGYQAAKQYADANGIKIYNATRGGKLEVFERVDFDILFDEKAN